MTASLLPAGQGVAPQVNPVLPTTAPLTESCAQPIEATCDPSVGSDWSRLPDNLEEPFPDLFSDLDLAPPVSALNPSQKRMCSPEPPFCQDPVEPNAPVSLPANDQSGFSAEQLATIKALSHVWCPRPFFRRIPHRLLLCPLRSSRRHLRQTPHVRGPTGFPVLRYRQPLLPDHLASCLLSPCLATWSFLGFRPSSRGGNRGVDWYGRVGSSV